MLATLTGLYPFLTSSISISVMEAIFSFSEISRDNSLLEDSTLMAVSSSNMLPYKTIVKYSVTSKKTYTNKTK